MGLVANKLVPVGVVVRDVPSLDTKGHNVVGDTLCIASLDCLGMSEGNEAFLNKLQLRSTQSRGPSSEGENL